MLFALMPLFAQGQGDGGAPPPGGGLGGLAFTLLPILVLFYFLMIRPAKRQENERKAMLDALKKNDKVVTAGGLIGTVAVINPTEDEVTLRVDDNANVRVRVTKSSITRVVHATADAGKEQKAG
jgi:preprotein translocase subunit YajC